MRMLTFIFRRLFSAIPTLILVSLFVFTLQKLLPGDPVLAMAGEERDPAVMEYLRDKYRLNDPVPLQYIHWVGNVLQGDFGTSLRTEQPVTTLLASKLPVTIELALLALIIALLIGIPTGVISAVRKGTAVDYGANVVALSGISIPHFWLGILLIMIFAVKLQWLPASGFVPLAEDIGQNLKTLVLPAFVLGAGLSGVLMRHTRSAMLEVLRADYVRTARAKGLFPRTVILKHALRNALMPIVTLTTLLFGELLGGAVLTEQVFSIPGFGKMIVDAVFNRDYAVVQGVVLCVAIGFLLLNLLADVLYRMINPRLRTA
jgi:peptide/nickel transport system permease protein